MICLAVYPLQAPRQTGKLCSLPAENNLSHLFTGPLTSVFILSLQFIHYALHKKVLKLKKKKFRKL